MSLKKINQKPNRGQTLKKHYCCGKVIEGNASWTAHKRLHRLKDLELVK